jgi:uncharacterized caspase-like protein
MADPPSRVYKIFQENPQTPQSAAASAAIAVGGTQPFYDWHEVSRNIPSHNYQGEIPWTDNSRAPGARNMRAQSRAHRLVCDADLRRSARLPLLRDEQYVTERVISA